MRSPDERSDIRGFPAYRSTHAGYCCSLRAVRTSGVGLLALPLLLAIFNRQLATRVAYLNGGPSFAPASLADAGVDVAIDGSQRGGREDDRQSVNDQ